MGHGGDGEIRTLAGFLDPYRFSRADPSTTWVHLLVYSSTDSPKIRREQLERTEMILMSMETENRLVINTFSKLRSLPDNTFSNQHPSATWVHLQRLWYYNSEKQKNQVFPVAFICHFRITPYFADFRYQILFKYRKP